jgi:hypothetical protein
MYQQSKIKKISDNQKAALFQNVNF